MEFLDAKLDEYCVKHTTQENALLNRIERETHLEVLQPRMLSGHAQGRLLSLISKLKGPKRILEIGTYTGYSAICLAEGLANDGHLVTIDSNEELEEKVKMYFEDSPFREKLELQIGDAAVLIPKIEGPFDIVFIDADKENYSLYFDLVIDKMAKGGLIIADNVLWSGKVVEEILENDISTQEILNYNKKIQNDIRVENILLPFRDGLMIALVL